MYDPALRSASRTAVLALACAPLAVVGCVEAASRPAAVVRNRPLFTVGRLRF